MTFTSFTGPPAAGSWIENASQVRKPVGPSLIACKVLDWVVFSVAEFVVEEFVWRGYAPEHGNMFELSDEDVLRFAPVETLMRLELLCPKPQIHMIYSINNACALFDYAERRYAAGFVKLVTESFTGESYEVCDKDQFMRYLAQWRQIEAQHAAHS